MLPHDQASGSAHGIFIERIGIVPNVTRQEGRTDGAAVDAVTVGFGAS